MLKTSDNLLFQITSWFHLFHSSCCWAGLTASDLAYCCFQGTFLICHIPQSFVFGLLPYFIETQFYKKENVGCESFKSFHDQKFLCFQPGVHHLPCVLSSGSSSPSQTKPLFSHGCGVIWIDTVVGQRKRCGILPILILALGLLGISF